MTTCVDCAAAGRALTRPAPFPGPRCATDDRAHRAAGKARGQLAHRVRTYGVTPEQDARLLEYQGGVCWVCRVATGAAKKLATDHDHKTGEVRGRLCGPCNLMIGRLKDSPAAFFRAALYLISPPSRAAWARRQLPDGSWTWANPTPEILRKKRR